MLDANDGPLTTLDALLTSLASAAPFLSCAAAASENDGMRTINFLDCRNDLVHTSSSGVGDLSLVVCVVVGDGSTNGDNSSRLLFPRGPSGSFSGDGGDVSCLLLSENAVSTCARSGLKSLAE